MKSLFFTATLLTLFLSSCSKNEDSGPIAPDTSAYEGTWKGSFEGDHDGPWTMYVTDHGTISQTFVGISGPGTGSGTVTESGVLHIVHSTGAESMGQFNAETGVVSGTWSLVNPTNNLSGSFYGTKQ